MITNGFGSRDETGKFPDYPSDEEGGSAIIFNPELRAKMLGEGESWEREESSSSDEEGGASNKKKADDKKGSGTKEADKNAAAGGGSAADKKNSAGGAAGATEEDESGYRLAKSEFVKGLRSADKQFYGIS